MSEEFRYLGKPMRQPTRQLDTFPAPEHLTQVRITSEELTSFCPVTGQPDFYHIEIEYQPGPLCIESKSLKLYLWSFRDESAFAERLADTIAQDVFAVVQPAYARVTLTQSIRGGLQIAATAQIKAQVKA
jgi:7-cyano-7-deazaguanine reductase